MPAPRKPTGRPSSFTKAMAERICDRLAEGESLRSICRTEGYPNIVTVMRWLDAFESFRHQYARAREIQAETLAAEILDIADTPLMGTIETTKEWGTEIKTVDMIEHRRLQVDARKWIAGKLKPKVYGVQQLAAANDAPPVDTPPPEEYVLRPDEGGPDAPVL